MWTHNEVEMQLRLTLDYKTSKLQESVDWESCQSKYMDITNSFRAQYPRELTDDFPHGDYFHDPGYHKAKMYSWQIQMGCGHGTSKWPRTGSHAVV